MSGALTGAAFNLVGSAFDLAKDGNGALSSGMMAAKVAAYGIVGGVSAVANGGRFESGFLSSGFSQAAEQFMDSRDIGLPDNPQGWESASNAAVAAVIGGIASKLSGGTFEQGALTSAMGRLFASFASKLESITDLILQSTTEAEQSL